MKTFKDLKVWQKSHDLTLEVYRITKLYPSEEKFGLVPQIRRSVSSIPTNLAEGFKRRSEKEFAHFVNIAEGSLEETKYTLFLSCELGYLDKNRLDKLNEICDEVGRMLSGLYKKLKT
ncbi:MAG: four helix bundle protein [Candidatus Omnitrophota bacterium]